MSNFARQPAGDTAPDDPEALRLLQRMAPADVVSAMVRLELAGAVELEAIPILLPARVRPALPPSVLPPPANLHKGPRTISGQGYATA